MDLRTGKTYPSLDAALAAGVPRSDLVEVIQPEALDASVSGPEIRFPSGPFKDRVYKRDCRGQLVRVR